MTDKKEAHARLAQYANEYSLDAKKIDLLIEYLALLRQWNGSHNLTSIVDWLEMVDLHVLDALTVLPFIYGKAVLDVGSGAGVPGIPLAIACSELAVHSVDSRRKKIQFQIHAQHALGVTNFFPVHSRVEQYQPGQKFDTLACRAFASLELFVKSSIDLCKPNGRLLAMKGAYPADELEKLSPEVVDVIAVHELSIPGRALTSRHLVEMAPANCKN
ncbi:MAG: 16S rRNA (guanine(527)-N(7))-methyltransferase RsmG [Proteobacteria bacterium]|jgi:16S rRNA (guanine527-N7)-methyltransferase|nr:16S rRNA (guanine(527)-N(7))-methyltransferase RsmG [Pseudomonadota bacterium]